MKFIELKTIPKKDILDGIMVKFDKETDTKTRYATRDIYKGQKRYEYPRDNRKVIAVYQRII